MPILRPLTFAPIYQTLVWGGRRFSVWRKDLPPGPIGESWDVSDHPRGQSIVDIGPFAGRSLSDFVHRDGKALLGRCTRPGPFPLMVKMIDAKERLSLQVHPDDELAQSMGVGENGKTECWVCLASGGAIFQGVRKGISRPVFQRALEDKQLEGTLNRFEVREGDVFFLPGRTVHAIGEECLIYELQQTSDITFRVYDWDRQGLDGKPRQLHVDESLRTVDFSPRQYGPIRPDWQPLACGKGRRLVTCRYFTLDELDIDGPVGLETEDSFILVTCLSGSCVIGTPEGETTLSTLHTALIPADARSVLLEPLGPSTVLLGRPGESLFG